ncbi:bloom syndrome [Favolaschia claudopus]|uniref:DNA 3'-5' helicase n=1 Tax=Favolaschia claudopus TaxID=2862362 RepID=A0AAW0AG33_9AGAR
MPTEHDHAKRTADSQHILQEAREKARRRRDFNSEATRQKLEFLFEEQTGKKPYEWQIDVSEALILGLDSVVIAGTGAGKTIPFMLPVMLHPEKFVLVISPLKVLQEDQASRFQAMGLKAAAVNGDTYSRDLQKVCQLRTHTDLCQDLYTQTHNAVLTSPEMCFEHLDFRKYLRDETTGKRILAVIIDEAHCISQWGGDFRPHYSMLNRLRALLPVSTPILATSATLNPSALAEVCSGLDLDLNSSFFLNLGNDRPNITPFVYLMNGGKDYSAVDTHLPDPNDVKSRDDLPKGLIFTNHVKKTQILCRHIRRRYPHLRGAIDFIHAHRSAKAKRRVMNQFRKGKIKLLISTEATGMVCGADVNDIELIIQFGVPSSLSVWVQRAGRAGRSIGIQARAILLVEKSMFRRQKKRKPGGGNVAGAPDLNADSSDSDSSSGSDDEAPSSSDPSNDGKEWGKNVDPVLREYISTKKCRRDMSDHYFNNPQRLPPTGDCCDNCNPHPTTPPRTPEPIDSPTSSAQSTPSKQRNTNGKRTMVSRDGPTTRRKEHLKQARSSLEQWRLNTYLRDYSYSSLTHDVLLPDKYLSSLASHRVTTLDDLCSLVPSWAFVDEHGADVLLLLRVDTAVQQEREREKEAKKQARRQETLKRQAERKAELARQKAANLQPRKRRGRPPKARPPLASTSNAVSVYIPICFIAYVRRKPSPATPTAIHTPFPITPSPYHPIYGSHYYPQIIPHTPLQPLYFSPIPTSNNWQSPYPPNFINNFNTNNFYSSVTNSYLPHVNTSPDPRNNNPNS